MKVVLYLSLCYLCFVLLFFVFTPSSLLSFWSLVSSLAQLNVELFFFSGSLSSLRHYRVVLPLVHKLDISQDWSYQQPPTLSHSKQQPFPQGIRPAPWAHVRFYFVLYFRSFHLFSFLPFLVLIFRAYVYTIGMFLVIFRCKWYGMVYQSSLVPFLCVPVLRCTYSYCFVFFHGDALRSLFCEHGLQFSRIKVSKSENILLWTL